MARLERTRRERDAGRGRGGAPRAARGGRPARIDRDSNLMPHFIRCAAAYATLGEMCGVLRAVFGEYREPVGV